MALEEFTGAYLRYVHRYVTMVHVDYLRTRELTWRVERRQGKRNVWSDIDVIGIRGNEAIVVSCDENCAKKVDDIVKELKYAEEYVRRRYNVNNIKKLYVFAICYTPGKCEEKFRRLEKEGIEILSFTDMIKDFIYRLRDVKRDYTLRAGKFTDPILWVLREIEIIRSLSREEVFPPIEKMYRRRRRRVLISYKYRTT